MELVTLNTIFSVVGCIGDKTNWLAWNSTRKEISQRPRTWVQYIDMWLRRLPPTGRLLHCQVEHHMRDKFATPILYGIDIF